MHTAVKVTNHKRQDLAGVKDASMVNKVQACVRKQAYKQEHVLMYVNLLMFLKVKL